MVEATPEKATTTTATLTGVIAAAHLHLVRMIATRVTEI